MRKVGFAAMILWFTDRAMPQSAGAMVGRPGVAGLPGAP
jgi:hypothetical protein